MLSLTTGMTIAFCCEVVVQHACTICPCSRQVGGKAGTAGRQRGRQAGRQGAREGWVRLLLSITEYVLSKTDSSGINKLGPRGPSLESATRLRRERKSRRT